MMKGSKPRTIFLERTTLKSSWNEFGIFAPVKDGFIKKSQISMHNAVLIIN